VAVALAVIVTCAPRLCASGDTIADKVAGQVGFGLNMTNFTDALGLLFPAAVAIDNSSTPPHLYVADLNNSRVLGWRNAQGFSNGAPADLVIGEPDFFHAGPALTNGPRPCASPTAVDLCFPRGVAVDSHGNLYVADTSNNRVLEYNTPFTSGTTAARVLGQAGSFTTNFCNRHLITAASLCGPARVALDDADHLFVSDFGNNRVLEYDSPLSPGAKANLVFGQLGSFTTGGCNRGGLGAATLCAPAGVGIDSTGNVYIADTANNRVLEYNTPLITRTTAAHLVIGQATLNAGRCNRGATAPSASTLCQPADVATDSAGNLYVADAANSRVLKYSRPLASDPAADRVFGQGGSFASAGCDLGGAVSAANLCSPSGLALDTAGDLFVSDTGNSRTLVYIPPFAAIPAAAREAGQPGLTYGGPNHIDGLGLATASSVALDMSVTPHRLYVADINNNRVLGWADASAAFAHLPANLVIGQPDAFSQACGGGTFCNPNGVAVDRAGNLYVADTQYSRIVEFNSPFTTDIKPDIIIAGRCNTTQPLCQPTGVALDAANNLFVANQLHSTVLVFKSPLRNDKPPDLAIGGPCLLNTARHTTGHDSICLPHSVAVDLSGNLYVADTADNRVLEYDRPLTTDIIPDRVFGQNGNFTSALCSSGVSGLCAPMAVAVDGRGDLFVADTGNSRVLEYEAPLRNSIATIVFGQGGVFSTKLPNKGGLSAGSLWLLPFGQVPGNFPRAFGGGGVATDDLGNLYVADDGNNRTLEFNGPFPTSTQTPTPTPTHTPTRTPTRTRTRTPTRTRTRTPTRTPTRTRTRTPTRTPTPTPSPKPFISSIPKAIDAGASFAIQGLRFTHGSVVNFFVATASRPINFGPLKPSFFSATQLLVPIPATITLGQGVATVQVVNTDQGFAASNTATTQLFGSPAAGFPNLTAINGVGLAATSTNPSFATDNVETVVVQGRVVTLDGNGFDTVHGVAVDLFCACKGGKVGPFFLNPGNPGLRATSLSFPLPSAGPNAPPTGPGSFVVSNKGSSGTFGKKSNAVSVPIGARITVASVSQSGTVITVKGTGFSILTVINLFNTQGAKVVNLGGLKPNGAPKIPLTVVNSTEFTLTRPAAAVPGPSYIQALNPPFVPFTSSGNAPGGSFTLK